jgi:hypothetical protein
MENWKQIKGHVGYFEVSDQGRVRSVPRTTEDSVGRKITIGGGIKALNLTNKGYYIVHLWRDGRDDARSVHRLVAEHFLGRSDKDVNHKDGDRLNNNVRNLEYVSPRENTNHWRKGSLPTGVRERNGRYQARIYLDGKQKSLGTFSTVEEAAEAYRQFVTDLGEGKYV